MEHPGQSEVILLEYTRTGELYETLTQSSRYSFWSTTSASSPNILALNNLAQKALAMMTLVSSDERAISAEVSAPTRQETPALASTSK
jgi:hypothetical protein